MQSGKKALDNFTSINGIGPAREKWLVETFNIYTYQELADLTPSQIESKIREEGKIVSRKNIESWIEQARELISQIPAKPPVEESGVTKNLVKKLGSSGFQNGWRPIASFLVYFQTREIKPGQTDTQTLVHYMEQDREASWPGIKAEELSNWMLENISEIVELPKNEEGELSESQQKTKSLAEIKIKQVRIFQPVSADTPICKFTVDETLLGNLKSNRPIRFAVDFDLTGRDARWITEQGIKCIARCYHHDCRTKTSALLAESSWLKLESGKLNYSFEIPEVSLSNGNYHIWMIVTNLKTNFLSPDFMKIDALTVV